MTIRMTTDEYEALLNWARVGASQGEQTHDLLRLRNRVDFANGIRRYTLVIRWEGLPQVPAPGITEQPKGNTIVLELNRPPTREDVGMALEGQPYHANLVWVTTDPSGEVGWHDLEHFPWQ